MNKQRKVLITITYNEIGIIIDTKAEEVAQPNLQPTCNKLATDCINRQAAIKALGERPLVWAGSDYEIAARNQWDIDKMAIETVPSADVVEVVCCKDCRWGREACGNIECSVDLNLPPEYHGYDWFCPNGERRTDE